MAVADGNELKAPRNASEVRRLRSEREVEKV